MMSGSVATTVFVKRPVENLGLPEIDARLLLSKATDDVERCGIIVDGRVYEFYNHHDEPMADFLLKGTEVAQFLATGGLRDEDVQAIWHTHPGGQNLPSENDCNGHPKNIPELKMVIVTSERINVYSIEQ